MDDDVNQETVDVEEPEEYVAHYQSSEIYSYSPDGATNPYCNHHSTDDATEQGAEYEAFCVLSKQNDPVEGPVGEPTKSKGPKKWNDVLRRHLVKKGRKKEQTDDSRKSFADVISGSIQKFFGRSSTYDEKDKYPEIANGFDSNSTTDDNMQSDHQQQQRNLANGDEEEEEEVDSDEMMWSDNEFDDDDFYANVDDFGEVDDKQNDEMEEEEVRQTPSIQVTSQSTQISTQATQVQTTEVFTPLPPLDAELDQVTTHSTQSPNERHLVEDSQVVYEFLDFRDYTISDDKIDDKKRNDNGDNIVDNFDLKTECVDLSQTKENDLVNSDSKDADKTTLDDTTTKHESDNSCSVKFNALLRNFNKTEDNSANTGINSSRLTKAEFNSNGVRSVLTNGERTDCSRTNRLEKQEPSAGRRSYGCLNSEKINHKWIPSKPADACVAKPGVVNPSLTYLTKPKPSAISDKTQSVSYVTDPTITSVRRPSITSVTKSSEISVAKPNVICVTRPSAINATKPDITSITKPSVTCSTTQANVTGLTKPGVSVLTKPSVTSATTKPSVTYAITKPNVTYATTKPNVTYATTKPSVTYATTKPSVNCSTPPSVTRLTKPCVTSVTTKPSVICATTKPSVTVLTEPSVTCATTKLSFTCATTKPSITSSTTKPSITSSTTKPIITSSTTKPSITSSTTKPSITSSTTKPDATSITKPSVVDCSEKPTVSAKERAVMFASLGAKKTDLHGRNLEELERISHQSNDTTCASGQSKTDTSRTQSPNIFSKIRLFENNKHPEKSSNQIGSNTKTTGLQDGDCGSNEGSKAASPAVLKKPNPMSDQRSFFSAKGTSGPPPLPVRKCPGSSNGPSGKTLPAKGGLAFMDWAQQDAPLVTSSRRRPPLPENDAPTDFYLAPADSATEAVKTTDDVDDVIVAYVDDFAFHPTSVKAKSQPLPPLPKGQPSKPKAQAGSIGSHGGTRWTGASTNEQKEHAETKISGGRSSVPAIPSVPRPPLPFRKFSEASTVTGGQTITTDVNFNELEEVKRNLGKKPGRISSERDQPFAGAPLSKPPLPPAARTSASEKDKKWKTWTGLPSENSTTNGMDELISALEQKSWYHGDLSRKECETLILSEGQNGRFVVRRRCDDVDGYPYALSIQHNNKMHNVLIRRRTDNTFALGNEKTNENVFSDIMEMVNFHRNNSIILSNNIKVTLTSSPTRR